MYKVLKNNNIEVCEYLTRILKQYNGIPKDSLGKVEEMVKKFMDARLIEENKLLFNNGGTKGYLKYLYENYKNNQIVSRIPDVYIDLYFILRFLKVSAYKDKGAMSIVYAGESHVKTFNQFFDFLGTTTKSISSNEKGCLKMPSNFKWYVC